MSEDTSPVPSPDTPDEQPDRFVIAHATDLDPDGGIAFEHAVSLTYGTGGVLYSLHAAAEGTRESVREMPDAADILRRWEIASPDGDRGLPEEFDYEKVVHTCCDDPVDTMLDALSGIEPDLLVVGKHRTPGVWGFLHDSVAESLALNAEVPTLFVPIGGKGFVRPADGHFQLQRILMPVADEESFLPAFHVVQTLADQLGARELELLLLHVGEGTLEDLVIPETAANLSWEVVTHAGPVHEAVIDAGEQWNADLVVMGTRGHDSLTDILRGSNTERVARQTQCPLLSVPIQQ